MMLIDQLNDMVATLELLYLTDLPEEENNEQTDVFPSLATSSNLMGIADAPEVFVEKTCKKMNAPVKTTKKRKLTDDEPRWLNKAPNYSKLPDNLDNKWEQTISDLEKYKNFTPTQLFKEVFSEETLTFIVKETLYYALLKTEPCQIQLKS